MTPADFIASLVIWIAGAIALSPVIGTILHRLEDHWQALEDTKVVLRIARRPR